MIESVKNIWVQSREEGAWRLHNILLWWALPGRR
jgi:hypothetical protein